MKGVHKRLCTVGAKLQESGPHKPFEDSVEIQFLRQIQLRYQVAGKAFTLDVGSENLLVCFVTRRRFRDGLPMLQASAFRQLGLFAYH